MQSFGKLIGRVAGVALVLALAVSTAAARQQGAGTVRGQVTDELGGAVIGATVTATDAQGQTKTATTNEDGAYTLTNLAPGQYIVRVVAPGFALYENAEVAVAAGARVALDIKLGVSLEAEEVTVAAEGPLNTDPTNNAGAIVLRGTDIEALPEDPDDLAAALQALAGPSAGPNGGQIYIDGFTGGRLPPRASIREVRINQNPFSAEYDRLGFGRIEILTRPGTDRYRGQVSFNFNDDALNSRNPFADRRPPIQTRQYGGNFGGPLLKRKASFFVDFDKRDVNDESLIVATVLDANNNIVGFSETVPIPSRRTSFSPRIDYQINANNTLVARYNYARNSRVTGVGGFSLPSRAYDTQNSEQSIQLTETAIINKTIVNETRFQFEHQTNSQDADNSIATIEVQEAFTGGGSQVGQSQSKTNSWELTNNASFAMGSHALKVGGRLRAISITQVSPQNFGGTYTFFGGALGPILDASGQPLGGTQIVTSIERYRR